MSSAQVLTPPTTPRRALTSVGDAAAVSVNCTALRRICQGELDVHVLDDVLVVLSTFDEQYPAIACKATDLVRRAVGLVKCYLQNTIEPQQGETHGEDNTETIPPLILATFELAKEVASWYDTNRNPLLEWDDRELQSTLGKLTCAVKTDDLDEVHSFFCGMLVSYHELLESMKPPEFTTLSRLVAHHKGESVALIAQAIDGLTRTYDTRFPEDAEPLTAAFTAWLASVGLALEKRELKEGDEDEEDGDGSDGDEDEQDAEKDDNHSDRSGGENSAASNGEKEPFVATPFAEWLATRQVTADARGLDEVRRFMVRFSGETGDSAGLLQSVGTAAACAVPELMVAFERAMCGTFLGKEDETASVISAQLAAVVLDGPEVFRKPKPTNHGCQELSHATHEV
ncbi:hypothetical protein NKR23_g10909 [Pleurostoma richardsiae]|uniref:Uncharacterized protein n=1 Tax=Pleurostoma richardsiae TaxID=41990 RepID=A0AA38R8V8_9PEZI|nr:hypothetical protein NKR23_g10909 [Pleurostoma richardsiae]